MTQGDGIVIRASHVRLWLGEHRLSGPGHKVGRAIAIEGAQDAHVVGGRIERFGIGAALLDASRCRFAHLDIRGGDEPADPAAGNPAQIGIMLINSAMNDLTDNTMSTAKVRATRPPARSEEIVIPPRPVASRCESGPTKATPRAQLLVPQPP